MEQWAQVITTILSTVGVIWWFRKESREDIKELRKQSHDDWLRCQNTIDAIKEDVKDFHERLLKIEMGRK